MRDRMRKAAEKLWDIEMSLIPEGLGCGNCPGWGIFDVDMRWGWEIERCDECGIFRDDEEAVTHVLLGLWRTKLMPDVPGGLPCDFSLDDDSVPELCWRCRIEWLYPAIDSHPKRKGQRGLRQRTASINAHEHARLVEEVFKDIMKDVEAAAQRLATLRAMVGEWNKEGSDEDVEVPF